MVYIFKKFLYVSILFLAIIPQINAQDSDGDGVPDTADIDDDNDGILDEDECDVTDGLIYEFYDFEPSGNTVDNIPTTGALSTGEVTQIDVDALYQSITPGDDDTFSIRYTGNINISQAGDYTFYTNSDDGSKLFIDGTEIVDNDGDHPEQEESGIVNLAVGDHDIEILFYEDGGDEILGVSYESTSLGIAKQDIMNIVQAGESACSSFDSDGDGIPNRIDLDSDNDGIPDIVEAGGTDNDNDGVVDGTFTDDDGDGWSNVFDSDNGGTALTDFDTDGDGVENRIDLDSDNDGIADIIEAGGNDTDFNGIVDGTFTDSDNDGWSDTFDSDDGGSVLTDVDLDTDSNGIVNRLDLDSDADGCSDANEYYDQTDADGNDDQEYGIFGNLTVNDAGLVEQAAYDGTGISAVKDDTDTSACLDTDGDGVFNVVDLDDDNDGITDLDECTEINNKLNYEFYDSSPSGDTVDNIPTTGETSAGTVNDFDVDALYQDITPGDDDTFSVRYTGFIYIETSDTYTFYTSSDDGTTLSINGQLVVDNDGLHGDQESSGNIDLNSGFYQFEVLYFENTGDEILSVQYESSSISKTPIPFSILYTENCNSFDSDGDGTPNRLDLDSDDDGCSDANEYYEDRLADGGDDGVFGSGIPTVDTDGLVTTAGYNGVEIANVTDDTVSIGCYYIQDTDGNWQTDTNWLNGSAPLSTNNAFIKAQSTIAQDQIINNLSLDTGSQVDVNSGFSLNVEGDIMNDSQFVGGGEVILNGSANQKLKGDGEYENLRLNNPNGADIISSASINGILYVDNGTFTTNDAVILPCDFSSTNNKVGQIGPVTGTISGDVTVEQCFPARRAFRLLSSSVTSPATSSIQDNWQEGATDYQDDPVPDSSTSGNFGFGTHITGNNTSQTDNSLNDGLDWTPTGNPSLFTFDNLAQSWNAVNNTKNNTLTAGDPYRLLVRGDRSIDVTDNATSPTNTKLRSKGSVKQGQVTVTDINGTSGNASFIGNPYQALVDMDAVITNSTNLQKFFVIWDPTLGGTPTVGQPGGRGAFVTVDATNGGTSIEGGASGSTAMNQYLQPYQAAFVLTGSNSTTPNVVFEEAHKSVSQSQVQVFSEEQNPHYLSIRLFDDISYSNGATADDGLQFYFSQNSSNAINDQDAPKFGNLDETLASMSGNNALLSIENRAMPTANDNLQLYNTQYRDTDYVFELEVGNFPENEVYLYDAHTDQQVLLNKDTVNTYSYSVDQSISTSVASDRFNIVFEQETFSISDEELQNQIKLFPNPAKDFVNISFGNLNLSKAQIIISDMQGRQIKTIDKNELSTDQIRVNTSELSQGIYFVRINSGQFQHTEKLIVE